LGMRLLVCASSQNVREVGIEFSLIGDRSNKINRFKQINIQSGVVELSLYSFRDELINLLGSAGNQDRFIRLSVTGIAKTFNVNIRRYNGLIGKTDGHSYSIKSFDGKPLNADTSVMAMLLSDPAKHPVGLVQKMSEGVGTGEFQIPTELRTQGLWLIYPSKKTSCQFRPELHFSDGFNNNTTDPLIKISSLYRATEVFHPHNAPTAISSIIEEMALDLDNSGWNYLNELLKNFSHLPLSTFEPWKALASNPKCLAVGLLRLDLGLEFLEKLRTDLAIIWEEIPVKVWCAVYKQYMTWFKKFDFPPSLLDNLMQSKRAVLREIIPGFKIYDSHLETENFDIKTYPLKIMLDAWSEDWKKMNDTSKWPQHLGPELRRWVQESIEFSHLENYSKEAAMNAVVFLPIFMAHVTFGLAKIEDLISHEDMTTYLHFSIMESSNFNREGWYLPVHDAILAHLLAASERSL